MQIVITGRNLDLDDALKGYIHKRLDKLGRLYRRIYKCEVILEEGKVLKNAEVILYLKRNRVVAKESSPDLYASIDNAADKVKRQLRRLSDRLSTRRRKAMVGKIMGPVARFARSERRAVSGEQGDIIKMNTFADKPMLPEEAKLELELLGGNFIMFKNADTGEANVLYRRSDGKYGLVDPDF
jgi:putative sigma-54 modulation protein